MTVSTSPDTIDLGCAAIDRGSTLSSVNTSINIGNPANASGTVTSIEIWASADLINCEVASFYSTGGDNFSTRGTETIGTVTAGSKQTFSVSLEVQIGDYIGIYYTGGTLELDTTGGDNIRTAAGDRIPCTDITFGVYEDYLTSLYGTTSVDPLNYIRFDIEEENIKLDDLGTPDDNVDLNASTTAHGLLPKLPDVATQFFDGTGAWGVLADGDIPDDITITAADTTDTTCFVTLWETITGAQKVKSDAALTYNAGTGDLSSTKFGGVIEENLLDKSVTEVVTANWVWTGTDESRLVSISTYSDTDAHLSKFKIRKSHQDTVGYTETVDNEDIGSLSAWGVGSDADRFDEVARILFEQDGAAGANNVPGRIVFQTATNAAAPSAALTLNSDKSATFVGAVDMDSLTLTTQLAIAEGGTGVTTGALTLLSVTTVTFGADGDTTLYTVPTGKRCVLSHAIVVAAGDAGGTTTLSIGANGTETDFIPANTLSNLDAQYDAAILQPIPNITPLKIESYAAATVIEAQVATQSGVAGNTVYLFGIIY